MVLSGTDLELKGDAYVLRTSVDAAIAMPWQLVARVRLIGDDVPAPSGIAHHQGAAAGGPPVAPKTPGYREQLAAFGRPPARFAEPSPSAGVPPPTSARPPTSPRSTPPAGTWPRSIPSGRRAPPTRRRTTAPSSTPPGGIVRPWARRGGRWTGSAAAAGFAPVRPRATDPFVTTPSRPRTSPRPSSRSARSRELFTRPLERAERVQALRGVDLSVREGEIFGLLGPERRRQDDAPQDPVLPRPSRPRARPHRRRGHGHESRVKPHDRPRALRRALVLLAAVGPREPALLRARCTTCPARAARRGSRSCCERVDMVEAADRRVLRLLLGDEAAPRDRARAAPRPADPASWTSRRAASTRPRALTLRAFIRDELKGGTARRSCSRRTTCARPRRCATASRSS